MRVLHVVPSFYPAVRYGGPIYSVLQLCLNLMEVGCEVRVLTTDANGEARLTVEEQRDPILQPLQVQFCRRVGRGMTAPQLVHRLCAGAAWAEIIHLTAVYNFPTLPTLLSARLTGKPLVWSPRGTLQRWQGSRRALAKAVWEAACRVLMPQRAVIHATSEEEASESAPRLCNPPTCVIPNGVDIPALPPPPQSDGVLKLLFLGRLDPKKGIENLISATALLSKRGIFDWSLVVAGEGRADYVTRLRNLAGDAGVIRRVAFCGNLQGEKKYRAFADCDVVVIPSHTENFGQVVAEALAHARPVIASVGTPWQAIKQHECGLWVDNDPGSLASAIQKMTRSNRIAMGLRGRDWMTTSFSWRERARNMLTVYEQLLRT